MRYFYKFYYSKLLYPTKFWLIKRGYAAFSFPPPLVAPFQSVGLKGRNVGGFTPPFGGPPSPEEKVILTFPSGESGGQPCRPPIEALFIYRQMPLPSIPCGIDTFSRGEG